METQDIRAAWDAEVKRIDAKVHQKAREGKLI